MIASLTIWDNQNHSRTERIVCKELIVKDGPTIDVEGEPATLFRVIAADGIFHNVATIEVV